MLFFERRECACESRSDSAIFEPVNHEKRRTSTDRPTRSDPGRFLTEESRDSFLREAIIFDKRTNDLGFIENREGPWRTIADQEQTFLNRSFPLGVARLTDHFIHKDPPSKKEIRRLEKFIESELKSTVKKIKKIGFSEVIGTAGTMINLASMVYEDRESKPFKLASHFRMKAKDLKKIHKKLLKRNLRELLKMPGLDLKRADIITAGSVLVNTLMKMLKKQALLVSNKGIREGSILDFILKDNKRMTGAPMNVQVQWFGQKPFFNGRIKTRKITHANL